MKIFIASPLFNPEQIAIIEQIERTITAAGHDFYSARLHSGSDKMTPEERKVLSAWDPIFESNVKGLDDCDAMIAVLEYAMPEDRSLFRCDRVDGVWQTTASVELPDAGTVWEMGYHRAQDKQVIGFHSKERPAHLNLMLTHGCMGLVLGFGALESFLRPGTPQEARGAFNWSACSAWEAEQRQVE